MSESNAVLLPCPFCGGEAEIKQYTRYGLKVRCNGRQPATGLLGCGANFQGKILPDRHTLEWLAEALTKKWNRRSTIADLIVALRPLSHIADLIDKDGERHSDDVGLWSRQSNFDEGFTLTLGDASAAKRNKKEAALSIKAEWELSDFEPGYEKTDVLLARARIKNYKTAADYIKPRPEAQKIRQAELKRKAKREAKRQKEGARV